MGKVSKVFLAVAVVLFSAQANAQESAPPQVAHAYETVVGNGSNIVSWVYPTVRFREVAGCRWVRAEPAYAMTCQFKFVDAGDLDSRTLRFRLSQWGLITDIEDLGGDSIFPAFFTLRATKSALVAAAKDELAKNDAMDDDQRAVLSLLAKSPQPEEVLALLLNIQIAVK